MMHRVLSHRLRHKLQEANPVAGFDQFIAGTGLGMMIEPLLMVSPRRFDLINGCGIQPGPLVVSIQAFKFLVYAGAR